MSKENKMLITLNKKAYIIDLSKLKKSLMDNLITFVTDKQIFLPFLQWHCLERRGVIIKSPLYMKK